MASKFYFAIPLRSKKASNDWNTVCRFFNHTIKSVLNQTNPDFNVLVACHDIPETDIKDPRLEFIQLSYPEPKSYDEQMLDKYYKKRAMMSKIRSYGGGYVMFFDADDLASNRIVDFVYKNDNKTGYYFPNGYELHLGRNIIKKAPKFHKLCGSSYILHFENTELPEKFEFKGYEMTDKHREKKYLFDHGHNTWQDVATNLYHKNLEPANFRGAVYIINTGENYSQMIDMISKKRKIFRFFSPGNKPNKRIIEEFSITIT